MKVLMVGFSNFFNSVIARETEMLLNHKEKGDEIYFLRCSGMNGVGCGNLLAMSEGTCKHCQEKQKMFHRISGLDKYIKEYIDVEQRMPQKEYFGFHRYENIEELMELEYQGNDIGRGIAAIIVSQFRDSEPELTDEIQDVIHRYSNMLVNYIDTLERLVAEYRFDITYVFSGRFPFHRATLRVMQKNHVDIYVSEVALTLGKYRLTYNQYPHGEMVDHTMADQVWSNGLSYEEKERLAAQWYIGRQTGDSLIHKEFHFVRDQKEGVLDCIKEGSLNIAVFISSEDEYVTIKEQECYFKNQNEVLQQIAQTKWDIPVNFIVRVHPNLRGLENAQTRGLREIRGDCITVIPAESPVSTYQLVRQCDLVLTFISTMGIEACFARKPVIVLGYAFYSKLLNTVMPQNHAELCEAINHFAIEDYHIEENYIAALKYAWWMMTLGVEFKHYVQEGLYHYTYSGKKNIWFYYYELKNLPGKIKRKWKKRNREK